MISLSIDNSGCRILGLGPEMYTKLKELLSYRISAQEHYYTGMWNSPKRTLLEKGGVFPTGLLPKVIQFIQENKLVVGISDRCVEKAPGSGLLTLSATYPPYPDQTTIVEAAVTFKRGVIRAPTGFGKSYTMALLIAKFQVPSLIVVPNIALREQLLKTFQEYFGVTKCGRICDKKAIAIENIDALDPKVKPPYDLLILDEAHHAAAKTYRKLNKSSWTGIFYRFSFTATPFRTDREEDMLLESVIGQQIYEVTIAKAIESGYICPIQAYYVDLPITKMKGNPNSWPAVYSELAVNNEYRNDIIQKLLLKLHVLDKSTLCLVKEIKHGLNLGSDGAFNFVCGEDSESRQFLLQFVNRELRTLIGTTGVCGEGIDLKPCEYVIIAGLGKAKGQFMQQVGRAVRTYPGKTSGKIIIFKDDSHKWTKAHFRAQIKILKDEYGVTPKRIEI